MSHMFKRLAALLMALAMVASMAACKDNSTPTATTVNHEQVLNTQAVTVGAHTLSAVELNYFFVDAVVDWYNANSSYAFLMGFDPTKPLSQQIISSSTGETWADSFLNTALKNIRSTYALYDLAMAENFTLSEEDQAQVDGFVEDMEEMIAEYVKLYESMGYTYPYSNVDDYLRTAYGAGSTVDSYMKYYEVCIIADAYYAAHADSINYSGKELQAYEADKYNHYCSYSYAAYYLDVKNYESAEQAKAVAQQLVDGTYADHAAFDEAIKALDINAGVEKPTLSDRCENVLYTKVSSDYIDWLADEARVSGDMTVIPKKSASSEDGTTLGYYVVRFEKVDDNKFLLKNVRHVLFAFEGGTFNAITGQTTYTKEEKEAARKEAENFYLEFCTGKMTEMIFANMANKFSDDGDGTTGGLYENIYPGRMVEAFEAWCYDPIRIPGDVGLIETEYGWHIMYFVGNTTYTFREHMLINDMKAEDMDIWYEQIVEAMQLELLDDSHVNKDLVLSK